MTVIPIDLTDDPIAEGATARVNFKVVDEDGAGLEAVNLDALTVTLFNERDGTIINSREDINILNVNGGIVGVDGVSSWTMDPDDNPILAPSPTRAEEFHTALFEWEYDSSNKAGKQPVRLRVVNLQHVT